MARELRLPPTTERTVKGSRASTTQAHSFSSYVPSPNCPSSPEPLENNQTKERAQLRNRNEENREVKRWLEEENRPSYDGSSSWSHWEFETKASATIRETERERDKERLRKWVERQRKAGHTRWDSIRGMWWVCVESERLLFLFGPINYHLPCN